MISNSTSKCRGTATTLKSEVLKGDCKMTLEQLIAAGLTKEQATTVLEMHKATLASGFIPKGRFDELNTELKASKDVIKERDEQITTLKTFEGTNTDLQKKIGELTAANLAKEAELVARLNAERLSNAMKLALGGKVHDVDLVIGLIDQSKVTLQEDGKLVGFEDLLTPLKASKKFLFTEEQAAPDTSKPTLPTLDGFSIKGATPPEGTPGGVPVASAAETLGKNLAAAKKTMTVSSADAEKAYFGV